MGPLQAELKRFVLLALAFTGTTIALAYSGPVGRLGPWFICLYLVCFVLLAWLVRVFPATCPRWSWLGAIVLAGALWRLLFHGFPPSNDVYRYVWEGIIQLHGFNPYLVAPADPALAELANGPLHPLWQGINHKSFAAIYPPLTLLVFRLLAAIQPEPLLFKSVFALCDLAVLLPLLLLVRQRQLPPSRLLWYAANPLLLLYFAGEGHLDSLMVLLMSWGLVLLLNHHHRSGFFLLGCAVMTKYMAAVAMPFMLTGRNWRRSWWALLPLTFFVPFAEAGSRWWQTLRTFSTHMHFNDSLGALLRQVAGPWAPVATAVILLVMLTTIFLLEHDPLRSTLYALGCTLLCLPTVHPWYLAWLAPVAALTASVPWLVLQASMAAIFPVWSHELATGEFQEIHGLKLLAYGPLAGILLRRLWQGRGLRGARFHPVNSVSVIIPALNEADHMKACLLTLEGQQGLHEIIVADGGSTDATVAIAKAQGAKIVSAPAGRGRQIAQGVQHSTGAVVLILHADSRLNRHGVANILDRLNREPDCVGGAMTMGFDSKAWRHRLIAGLNNLRARSTGIAFGDQGQFFRRQALEAMGGFPRLLLMEDVELSLRLKNVGRVLFLKQGLKVSGRRWQQLDLGGAVAIVLRLFVRYLVERRLGLLDANAADYYRRYYGHDPG